MICTSLQTDNHTNTSSVNLQRPDALPDAQPCRSTEGTILAMISSTVVIGYVHGVMQTKLLDDTVKMSVKLFS